MISIFNGRKRSLGSGDSDSVFVQVSVDLRAHLHEFKNSSFIVFMAICLHANEDGEAWPSVETLCRETGKGAESVREALAFLRTLRVDGQRVLVSRQQPGDKGKFGSNRYLLFPSDEEIAETEVFSPCTGFPCTAEPLTAEPCTVEPSTDNPPTKNNQSLNQNHILEEEPLVKSGKPQRAKASPASARVKSLPIPGDWQPTPEMVQKARADFPGVNLRTETDCFVDHFTANGKPMADWSAAWRNWMRRSPQFKSSALPARSSAGNRTHRPTMDEARAEIREDLQALQSQHSPSERSY